MGLSKNKKLRNYIYLLIGTSEPLHKLLANVISVCPSFLPSIIAMRVRGRPRLKT